MREQIHRDEHTDKYESIKTWRLGLKLGDDEANRNIVIREHPVARGSIAIYFRLLSQTHYSAFLPILIALFRFFFFKFPNYTYNPFMEVIFFIINIHYVKK